MSGAAAAEPIDAGARLAGTAALERRGDGVARFAMRTWNLRLARPPPSTRAEMRTVARRPAPVPMPIRTRVARPAGIWKTSGGRRCVALIRPARTFAFTRQGATSGQRTRTRGSTSRPRRSGFALMRDGPSIRGFGGLGGFGGFGGFSSGGHG
jgi:hypothetical protein